MSVRNIERVTCETCLWSETGLRALTRAEMVELVDGHLSETGHVRYRVDRTDLRSYPLKLRGRQRRQPQRRGRLPRRMRRRARRIAETPSDGPVTLQGRDAPDLAAAVVQLSQFRVTVHEADHKTVVLEVHDTPPQ